MQCQNNLKQVGLAWISHESLFGFFPTGGRFNYLSDFETTGTPRSDGSGDQRQRGSWAFQILPFIEHDAIWRGDGGQTPQECKLASAGAVIQEYTCPSRDVRIQESFGHSGPFDAFLMDYAANAGSGILGLPTQFVFERKDAVVQSDFDSSAMIDLSYPPAKYVPSVVRSSHISDGLSNTVMVGEKRLCVPYGMGFDDSKGYSIGFDIDSVRWMRWPPAPAKDSNDVTYSATTTFGSLRPGFFSAVMCDGSVKRLSISLGAELWQSMGTVRGGEIQEQNAILLSKLQALQLVPVTLTGASNSGEI